MTRKRKTQSTTGQRPAPESRPQNRPRQDADVRIIGGEFRGRRLLYHGDPAVRPMKHRVREAIFNLISTEPAGRHAIDLFAGTGALGLEALSRGAIHATLIEKHVPTARLIEENIRALGVENRTTLLLTSAFLWAKRDMPAQCPAADCLVQGDADHPQSAIRNRQSAIRNSQPAWLVFCSPPYAFFVENGDEMLDLIRRIQSHAPSGSVLVVETDERFDFDLLRASTASAASGGDRENHSAWLVRAYPPAVVGIWRKAGD
jgi:16S rRNA (guanine966-N2)-methyltransferase